MVRFTSIALGVAALLPAVAQSAAVAQSSAVSKRIPGPCPPFNKGTFNINSYQLYPENADWDGELCQVYFGILFNASFGIYNPYLDHLDVIEFPGITRTVVEHVGGVGWDKYTGLVSVLVNAAAAFNTAGADVSGTNIIKKYDPRQKKFLWSLNITAVTNGAYGGFNDVSADPRGNTYVVGTFPSSIMRVPPDGSRIQVWYLSDPIVTTQRGYAGIANVGDTLLAMDSSNGELFRFDTRACHGTPVHVPRTPNTAIGASDGIHLPLKFGGTILLVAQHALGVAVLRSRDGLWITSEYLGNIPNPPTLPAGVLAVSTVQIGNSLYIVNDWFADPFVPGTTAGNKTSFPMIDITAQVDALLI